MLRFALYAVALFSACGSASAASILARCGPSTGQSYYFEAGIVGPGQGGWRKDGFDGGRIIALLNDKDQLDIILKDTTGVKSYLKEGYKVSLIQYSKADRSFLVMASGDNFVETYTFEVNNLGVGTVAWTANKLTELVIRTSIMTAECGPKYSLDQ